MTIRRTTSALALAVALAFAALPAAAAETPEQLDRESARYASLAAEQTKLAEHHALAATANVKGGQQARAAYHQRQATEYRAKSQLLADRAADLREAAKRVAQN